MVLETDTPTHVHLGYSAQESPDTYYAFIKEFAAGILASSVPVMTTNVGFGYEWEVIASASPAACCFKLMRDKSDNRYYITHVLSIIATTIQI